MLQGGAGGDEKQVINFAWPYAGTGLHYDCSLCLPVFRQQISVCSVYVCICTPYLCLYACICRLISIGVEFCGEGSSSLQDSMRQQSLNYFKNYHRYSTNLVVEDAV